MTGPTDDDYNTIIDTLKSGDCVPFLGAGASLGYEGVGLPTAGELARKLAAECGYRGSGSDDFLRVCQYYELKRDPRRLRKAIIEQLSVPGVKPSAIHRLLATFPVTHVLTTNYDKLMEQAFRDEGKDPDVAVYNIQAKTTEELRPGTKDNPVVYKMHGSMDDPTSMICTEDHVVQFLARLIHEEPPLPNSIKELFENRSFLFIGYGLRDWNVRVMIRSMRWRNPVGWIKSFAIQRKPENVEFAADWESAVLYWNNRENIQCFDEDALDFVQELGRRYTLSPVKPPDTLPAIPPPEPRRPDA
jgi:NAD-dependent SIR2 family protein deacetylase